MGQPKPLVDLLASVEIDRQALPSNLKYGKAIYRRGGVEIIESTPEKIVAWVGGLDGSVIEGGGQRRRTELLSTTKGLQWRCAGNPKDHQIFCKHCVALALTVLQQSS